MEDGVIAAEGERESVLEWVSVPLCVGLGLGVAEVVDDAVSEGVADLEGVLLGEEPRDREPVGVEV